LPARIQPGLPIELLRRRPDVAEAERQLASATALIGAATAQLFPQVVVTGSFGAQQGRGVTAAAINPIWSVGPAVAVPLLDFGRLDAAVERADFRSRELLFNYKQTVLNAVREVDAAVSAYAAQQERLRYLSGALVAARRAVSLAQQRFERGLTDSLNVIDAQRQAYELEQQYVIAQASAAAQFVTLYRSLGGGWEPYQAVPPIPQPMPAILAAFRRLLAPRHRAVAASKFGSMHPGWQKSAVPAARRGSRKIRCSWQEGRRLIFLEIVTSSGCAERGFRGLTDLPRCIFATNSTKCDRMVGEIAAMEPDVIQPSRAKSRAGKSVGH